jgi:hypothetical protein
MVAFALAGKGPAIGEYSQCSRAWSVRMNVSDKFVQISYNHSDSATTIRSPRIPFTFNEINSTIHLGKNNVISPEYCYWTEDGQIVIEMFNTTIVLFGEERMNTSVTVAPTSADIVVNTTIEPIAPQTVRLGVGESIPSAKSSGTIRLLLVVMCVIMVY